MPAPEPARVGYVLKMYPRLAETFILNEILAHEAAGLELEIFSLRAPIDGRFHRDLGRVRAKVTYLGGPSVKAEEFFSVLKRGRRELPGGGAVFQDAEHETAGDLYQAIGLAEAARAQGIGHLHAHFATAATTVTRLAAALAGVPYSFTAHAKDIFHESVEDEDLRRKLRDAATCITVSDFNQRHLRQRFGPDAECVRRVYNGLDLSEFSFASPEARPPMIIGVGRLVDKKGFADLIEACALLAGRGRALTCQIIGDGVLQGRLAEQVEALEAGAVVHMTGSLPRDQVRQRMQEAAVLAAPCVISPNGNRDGLPTVLLEAMALGTPCVSTDVTGIPEIVRDGETGLLVAQHDPAALADALERMLDDRALRVALARAARSLVEAEFDIHRNTPILREIFRSGGARALQPLGVG